MLKPIHARGPARLLLHTLAAGLMAALMTSLPASAQTHLLILTKDGKTQTQALSGIRKVIWQSPDLVFQLEGDRTLRVPHADIQRITFTTPTALHRAAPTGAGPRLISGAARGGRLPVRLDLPGTSPARVEILALDGRLVAILADGIRAAGSHDLVWDGRDRRGLPAEPGAYILRAATPSGSVSSTLPWLE